VWPRSELPNHLRESAGARMALEDKDAEAEEEEESDEEGEVGDEEAEAGMREARIDIGTDPNAVGVLNPPVRFRCPCFTVM
jgi:hypothetical protein